MKKTSRNEFSIEKIIKGKGDSLFVKWKGHDSSFNKKLDKKVGLIKKTLYKNEFQYFPKPYKLFGGNINIQVYLSSNARKTD